MKQALIFIEEIKRKKQAIRETKSQYLKNDYAKSVKNDIKELQDYCFFKGLDFSKLLKLLTEDEK